MEYPLKTLIAIIAQATVFSCRFSATARRVTDKRTKHNKGTCNDVGQDKTDYYTTPGVASQLTHTQSALAYVKPGGPFIPQEPRP